MYDGVLNYARKRLAMATINEDYDTCEDMNACITFLERNADKNGGEEPVITVPMKIEETKQMIQTINDKYDEKLSNHEEQRLMKLREMKSKNDAEFAELEAKVSSPTFLHQFDKPSSQLQRIRKMQKFKALHK